ncbi:glycoside hydrolase family 2 TIM barrel-domain containing protein [Nonomuraea angiospora]|uniref:glycoside hydrolase family 2 TIM barrel-domain containing protein n=1 Tax=Nonomuraea angiospora TaxID=46172 RepID=UPI0029B47597|nr:glycoside hydrolase family 2 TIM barrel-domain containing protein [Nonomuraea angiospora]MDX3100966.1 glycoside hydrolase family 2 TIM barrel-domain containing protein [Nonomuraea angiospora]
MSVISFNDGWACRAPQGPFAGAFGGAIARDVRLPHDALRDETRQPEAPGRGAGAYFPAGAYTYVKRFEAPQDWARLLVQLEIQGAFRRAQVFVNDEFAGNRADGYARFFVDLTPFLKAGRENELRIEVRSGEDSRWYSGAGLHRPVLLHLSEPLDVVPDGVTVETIRIEDDLAVVEVRSHLRNAAMNTCTTRVRTVLNGPDGQVVAEGSVPLTLAPAEGATSRQRFYVRSPSLWSPDEPILHTATVSLEGREDVHVTTFGIRTVAVDPLNGLRINGRSVLLRGACVHHDNGPLGAAALPRAEERRVELLKAAGFNAIRAAHNPLSVAMLDACDRLGVLVMDEAFDMWTRFKTPYDYAAEFPQWWEADLESMVAKDRNHPSVVMYSIGNEIAEVGSPHGARWARRLADHVRALDPSRPVTNGVNAMLAVLDELPRMAQQAGATDSTGGGLNELGMDGAFNAISALPQATQRIEESSAALDVLGLNYADSRYEMDRQLFPGRVIVGSETFPSQIGRLWPLVLKNPNVIGDFTWTGWDYLGEVGIGSITYESDSDAPGGLEREFPFLTALTGDIDITGWRRPISYYREIVFGLRTAPYIAVQRPERHDDKVLLKSPWAWSDTVSSWTWTGHEGQPVTVEVYADADEVALLLDGAEVARRKVGIERPCLTEFEIVYFPGELTAVAYSDGVETGRMMLQTAGSATTLQAISDRYELANDDLAFISVDICDADGLPVSNADAAVTITVEGAGVLAGMCSARPATTERFDGDTWRTFDGRALAVIRSTGPGPITVTASAPGLAAGQLSLHVTA